MLQRSQLITQLDAKCAEIVEYERNIGDEAASFAHALSAMTGEEAVGLRAAMLNTESNFGAAPSTEFDACECFVREFDATWRSHEEARKWAVEVLRNRTTFAADGSQLLPGRDISLPLGCLQIAEFENPHNAQIDYRKKVNLELLTPADFRTADADTTTPDIIIASKRFDAELKTIEKFFIRQRTWREEGKRMPLAFFDGTLVASFTKPRTEWRERYVAAVTNLLDQSEASGVPVVGFIDQSYARDLTAMVDYLNHRTHRHTDIYDAQILRSNEASARARLNGWGSRSIFCYCLRQNLSDRFRDKNSCPRVGFCYLQTTSDGTPARLDVPSWIHDAGLLDEVIDTVRAECVVGNGYPYALETADAAAVLTAQDRAQFFQIIDEYAARESVGFRISRKALSKSHRR